MFLCLPESSNSLTDWFNSSQDDRKALVNVIYGEEVLKHSTGTTAFVFRTLRVTQCLRTMEVRAAAALYHSVDAGLPGVTVVARPTG